MAQHHWIEEDLFDDRPIADEPGPINQDAFIADSDARIFFGF